MFHGDSFPALVLFPYQAINGERELKSSDPRPSFNVPIERHLFVAHVDEFTGQAIELRRYFGGGRRIFTGWVHGRHGRLYVNHGCLFAIADVVL
jgi:hypothetical protein